VILPIDLASANAWFHDPDLRTTAEHMALHRELVEAGIVAWLRAHNPSGRSYTNGELADLIEAGEHIREAL